jgi:hypothetical protein
MVIPNPDLSVQESLQEAFLEIRKSGTIEKDDIETVFAS